MLMRSEPLLKTPKRRSSDGTDEFTLPRSLSTPLLNRPPVSVRELQFPVRVNYSCCLSSASVASNQIARVTAKLHQARDIKISTQSR